MHLSLLFTIAISFLINMSIDIICSIVIVSIISISMIMLSIIHGHVAVHLISEIGTPDHSIDRCTFTKECY